MWAFRVWAGNHVFYFFWKYVYFIHFLWHLLNPSHYFKSLFMNMIFNLIIQIMFLWVGPLAAATLLWWSKHKFGTKSDVTLFLKPVDTHISFINRPPLLRFGGGIYNDPDTMSFFTWLQVSLRDFGRRSLCLFYTHSDHVMVVWPYLAIWGGKWGQLVCVNSSPGDAHPKVVSMMGQTLPCLAMLLDNCGV